jgi:hypothetical protein
MSNLWFFGTVSDSVEPKDRGSFYGGGIFVGRYDVERRRTCAGRAGNVEKGMEDHGMEKVPDGSRGHASHPGLGVGETLSHQEEQSMKDARFRPFGHECDEGAASLARSDNPLAYAAGRLNSARRDTHPRDRSGSSCRCKTANQHRGEPHRVFENFPSCWIDRARLRLISTRNDKNSIRDERDAVGAVFRLGIVTQFGPGIFGGMLP